MRRQQVQLDQLLRSHPLAQSVLWGQLAPLAPSALFRQRRQLVLSRRLHPLVLLHPTGR